MEICGRIDAVGDGLDPGWRGTRVAAYCGSGGLAEYVIVKAEACAPAPHGVSDEAVAALPVAYGSSELGLVRRARLQAGEILVVAGAGGGVGLTAVEIGALLGARVIALARGEAKQAAARAKGAELVLDSDAFDLDTPALRDEILALTNGHGADVIFDPVGGALGTALMRATAFEGRVMPIGFASGDVLPLKANHLLVKNIDVLGFWWGAYFDRAPEAMAESLGRLFDWAADGKITPLVSDVLPLERAVDALRLIEDRKATGKVVVKISG
jgi:NADPH2:quinone reductase